MSQYGNPNLVQVPMVYEKLVIRECLMNSQRYHRLLKEVYAAINYRQKAENALRDKLK